MRVHEVRDVARTLVIDHNSRILLLDSVEPSTSQRCWITPGGGINAGEDAEEAARRELIEETGLSLPLGPCVWIRTHIYGWRGKLRRQNEWFYVAPGADPTKLAPAAQDRHTTGHKWWSLSEIRGSSERFSPGWLADSLPQVIHGNYPSPPLRKDG